MYRPRSPSGEQKDPGAIPSLMDEMSSERPKRETVVYHAIEGPGKPAAQESVDALVGIAESKYPVGLSSP